MSEKRPTYKAPKDLPIYRAAEILIEVMDDIHDDFRRDRRHTHWQSLMNMADKMPFYVCIAQDFPEHREEALLLMLGTLSIMQGKLSMCTRRGYISEKSYLMCARPFASIERQATGWLASTRRAGVGDGDTESAYSYKGGSTLAATELDELRTS